MKTKGLRKSKNIQDVRGPTGAYSRPSALKAAADNRRNQAFWEGKGATASGGKMAHSAGAHGVENAAARDEKKTAKKPLKGKR